MANSPPPSVVATSNGDLPYDTAATAGTNMVGTPTAVVQFNSVATTVANSITDAPPLTGVVAADNPSTKRLRHGPSGTVSATSRGKDKHPVLDSTTA